MEKHILEMWYFNPNPCIIYQIIIFAAVLWDWNDTLRQRLALLFSTTKISEGDISESILLFVRAFENLHVSAVLDKTL